MLAYFDHSSFMQLFGSYTSPFVRHCRIVLLETGLECEFVEADSKAASGASAAQRVPFFKDGDVLLTDSSSIVFYLREKARQTFLNDAEEMELFALANTVMDAEINVFCFEKYDGMMPSESKYLTRQKARVETGLDELEQKDLPGGLPLTDAYLRLCTLLDWGLFRERFSLANRPRLAQLLELAQTDENFRKTSPPGWRE